MRKGRVKHPAADNKIDWRLSAVNFIFCPHTRRSPDFPHLQFLSKSYLPN